MGQDKLSSFSSNSFPVTGDKRVHVLLEKKAFLHAHCNMKRSGLLRSKPQRERIGI